MHTNRISPARKIILWLGLALGLVLLTGCEFQLTNLTPTTLPENPSQIYTLTLRVTQKATSIVPGSIDARIVIDGQNVKMNKSSLGDDIYELDYQLPPNRDEMAYYYLVSYLIEAGGQQREREVYTDIIHTKIVRRNVLALLANRGPVGARIGVLGRGFTPQDVVYVDNTPARTVFESANALSFYVPALDTNKSYKIALGSAAGNSFVGTFRIDPSSLQVSPSSLTLRTGERQTITFTVPNAAGAGGLLLDITTDVPEAVIMPEVVVPAGQTSVSVTVEGGKAGSGSLFLKGYGSGELTVPVTVTAK
ncbi:MAG TPA: cell surface protein [Opitutaceae bacterium]|nr:cell surface protein [Opitutaceae bacterium]